MKELLERVIAAHGNMDRWNGFKSVRAHVLLGGGLWALKGQGGVLSDGITRVELHRQFASTAPFREPGLRSSFTPDRVAIETENGEVVEERFHPRDAFAGHDVTTPWDRLHLAYFNGYAMWGYLTEPFSLAGPGFEAEELEPWQEDGETWRRLRVLFPDNIAAHSKENVYYINADGHIMRHDYVSEVLGPKAPLAAGYASDHREFDGFVFPAKRLIYAVGEGGHPMKDQLLVSIDLSDVTFD